MHPNPNDYRAVSKAGARQIKRIRVVRVSNESERLREKLAREAKERKAAAIQQMWADIDAAPRIEANRINVKRPKAAPFVNHRARYRQLRRAANA